MTWIIDSDGDLRYDAPDGCFQHIVAHDLALDPTNESHLGTLTATCADKAHAELVQLVKDGLRWRQMYRAALDGGGRGERVDAILAEVQEILRTADPADKEAWRLP